MAPSAPSTLAAPRRTVGEVTYSSVLKTTGEPYTNKTIDLKTRQVSEITIPQATEQEIADTVKVMGGEDLMAWMLQLQNAGNQAVSGNVFSSEASGSGHGLCTMPGVCTYL